MNEKIYPNAVVLKSSLVGVVAGSILLVMLLIIRNLYYSTHQHENAQTGHTTEQVTAVANDSDLHWFQVRETSRAQSVNSKPELVHVSPPPVAKEVHKTEMDHKSAMKQVDEKIAAAMSAAITSNQLTANDAESHHELSVPKNDASEPLNSIVKNPLSIFELQAGTIIPGVLITGINSDLPGQITGLVRSNVYDSISGKYLLIPQGAKLIGMYESKIAYGQKRVLIAWNRILFPNGQSMDLQGMHGVDLSGYSGFKDLVDNHYIKIFGSVVLISSLGAGAQLSQPESARSPQAQPTVGQTLAGITGTHLANTGMAMTEKNLNIAPTLEVRPGYQFNISVAKDLVFARPYDG